jgi:uncharacterized oxidoreductase
MNTSGNTILITGAGTGMGLAAARAFSECGNTVVMVARNEARLREEAAKLKNVDPFACDISDANQVERLLDHVGKAHPDLNWLFLNAGVTNTYELFSEESMIDHARDEMTVNYLSTVHLTERFVPVIAAKPNPAMIITTSGVIYAPDVTNPTYSATKAALHSFIQSARHVLAKKGSPIKWFELVAGVRSDLKASPESVIEDLIRGIEANEIEIRPGLSNEIYQAWREDPEKAFATTCAAVGA